MKTESNFDLYLDSTFKYKMENEDKTEINHLDELPDSWWHRVYVGVAAAMILVIAALWSFSRYFS